MVVVLDKFFPLLVIWKSFLFFVNFFFEERKRESEVAQSCLTVCNSVDSSLPGSSVHGILQARVLEWDAVTFSDIAGGFFTSWATRETLIYTTAEEIYLRKLNSIHINDMHMYIKTRKM